jgi:DNA-binding transcriptional LysR family regulator
MAGPLRRVEIAELRGFCAAVELGSLSSAARLLRISQPALSKRMRELEALAGAKLLERSSRGVLTTPAGARLYEQARALLAQAERVEAVIANLGGEQVPVRLAASHTIAEFVLPKVLSEYEARYERHLAVELLIANSKVVGEMVREGRVDFGIAAIDPAEGSTGSLEQLDLCEDEVIVAVPRSHPWSKLAEVPLEELLRTPMVMRDPSANTRRVVEAVLRERGETLSTPLAEVGSTEAALAAAIAEGSPALLSSLALRGGDGAMIARRVGGIGFLRRFVILYAAREALRRDAQLLMEHLHAQVRASADHSLRL